MGLINARNLRRAKRLLDKNRHKLGDLTDKAGEKLDKVSKGKTSNLTAKASEAAHKYSDGGVGRHDFGDASGDHDGMPAHEAPRTSAEAEAANIAAANAMTDMANAATDFMNSAAAQAQPADQGPGAESAAEAGVDEHDETDDRSAPPG